MACSMDNSGHDIACHAEEMSKKDEILIYKIPLKNCMIILMKKGSSLTLYRYVSIEALCGTVTIFGYEIKPGDQPLKVFSSEKTGLIEIKTQSFDPNWRQSRFLTIKEELMKIINDSVKTELILNNRFDFLIIMRIEILPVNIQYLELYFPHALELLLLKKERGGRDIYFIRKSIAEPIQFSKEAEELSNEINVLVHGAKLPDVPPPRILIYGGKSTGKSSLLRFLINKMLSVNARAYYLDADPGQTEFTPPGVVSLIKVTKPIVGPPFMHMKKPVSMVFTGAISPDASPDMYCKSIYKLMQLYKKDFSDEPLFINTIGWIKDLELFCLQNVLKVVEPTILIELANEDEMPTFDYREYLPKGSRYFQLKQSFVPKKSYLNDREMREISVLAYLGKCLNEFEGPKYINEMKPYRVCWDKIPLFLFGKKVPLYLLMQAINASIVALCKVSDTVILETGDRSCPKTLEDEPDNECLGFGLVRAMDKKKHLFYIITPLRLNTLRDVNSILKGNVMVPGVVFLNQPILNTPLPFTNERDIPSPAVDEKMPDFSMLSLKPEPASKSESPAANSTPPNSVKFGHKKMSKKFMKKRK